MARKVNMFQRRLISNSKVDVKTYRYVVMKCVKACFSFLAIFYIFFKYIFYYVTITQPDFCGILFL